MMGERNRSRYPFTPSQWEELENQALIFKYMATGTPIPHDLILPIRSFYPESISFSATQLFPLQSGFGWGCHQMAFGRKGEDPEPWRCRRTDGKKWRCSKEAHPDSKYCEKHMHRGKNRSRKHVEAPVGTSSTTAAAATSYSGNSTTTTSHNPSTYPCHLSIGAASGGHNFGYHFSSSSRDTVTNFSPRSESTRSNIDPSSSSVDGGYRYGHGCKVVNRHYLPEASIAESDVPCQLNLLDVSSLREPGRRSCSSLQRDLCFTASGLSKEEESEKGQQCFILGTNFTLKRRAKAAEVEEEELRQPLRQFFGDWPSKSKDPWMDQQERPDPTLHLHPHGSPGVHPGHRLPDLQW